MGTINTQGLKEVENVGQFSENLKRFNLIWPASQSFFNMFETIVWHKREPVVQNIFQNSEH